MDISKDYLGRVVNNEDPTFSGRCKINVFGLFDDLEPESLPWIAPQTSNIFSSDKGCGSISVPKLGTIVRVKFPFDNLYAGEYSYIQNIDPSLIEQIKDDYQNTHVLLYDSDQDLMVIYQPMLGYKMSLCGSLIIIDADGTIQLKHQNNSNIVELTDSEINIITTGDGGTNSNGIINIASGATVNVNSPTVNVNANTINLGKDAGCQAVKGEELIGVLKEIVVELACKAPMGTKLAGRNFKEILSDTVYLN